ncbi:MAG TPA: prolyl oligopeptidase family serine peptidase, partial [Verrucomicrobiae bacterium]|nr:prolyl oligopeptidase family serine peptidase [Verrucomicrobiae bacterium]
TVDSGLCADRLPPPGIKIDAQDRQELAHRVQAFGKDIESAEASLGSQPRLLSLMPDVRIFHKAVDWALRYDEFFEPRQVEFARKLLDQGEARLAELRSGKTPWLSVTGLVARGYRSKLDGSIQPYGLLIPPGFKVETAGPTPLWVWFAGRNEKRTELAFLRERETSPGSFTPSDAIVLHPYGRFCNANKFAGEVDVFEAMDAVSKDYPIDRNRILEAGFSMGGASAWHMAVHHPGDWCGASAGAGFAETEVYAKIARDPQPTPWWEMKLFRWYDATDCAGNLFNCPMIAYSGEIDPQKQAADIMEQAMAREGLNLERFIGPNTAHKYEPATRDKLAKRLEQLVTKGRDPMPREIRFTTYTLRYPDIDWLRVEGLEHHWERADVHGFLEGDRTARLLTTNVTAVSLAIPTLKRLLIDGERLSVPRHRPPGPVLAEKQRGRWKIASARPGGMTKHPGLTGPVDDAFMDSFLFVRPTGKSLNPRVDDWCRSEMSRAQKMWRDIFRGEAPIIDDIHLTTERAATNNLILWGDPRSNRVIGALLDSLPLKWDEKRIIFNGKTYDAADHAPILIFPSSLGQGRYIVINSGIDFRNDAYGSNARQTPKLPDYAIVDLNTPPGPRWPGDILDAGFFNEHWELPNARANPLSRRKSGAE